MADNPLVLAMFNIVFNDAKVDGMLADPASCTKVLTNIKTKTAEAKPQPTKVAAAAPSPAPADPGPNYMPCRDAASCAEANKAAYAHHSTAAERAALEQAAKAKKDVGANCFGMVAPVIGLALLVVQGVLCGYVVAMFEARPRVMEAAMQSGLSVDIVFKFTDTLDGWGTYYLNLDGGPGRSGIYLWVVERLPLLGLTDAKFNNGAGRRNPPGKSSFSPSQYRHSPGGALWRRARTLAPRAALRQCSGMSSQFRVSWMSSANRL